MAKLTSNVEAMQNILTANENIDKILQEDLAHIDSKERSIDLWLEKFGKDESLESRKKQLIKQEMIKTDAEIFLNFQQSLN